MVRERIETDARRSPAAEVTLQTRRAACTRFHLSLSHRSLSPFSCLAPSLIPLPLPPLHHLFTRLCLPSFMRFTSVCHYHFCLSLCMILGGFRSPIKKSLFLTFFPFIYVLYITSQSFIHWFRDWRPSFKGMCVAYIGQLPLLIGAMQWLVFINKSSYTELKLACWQESCKL